MTQKAMTPSSLKPPFIIGHRGACGHAPENTLASLKKATELGLSWVEFDVMLAGCGEPIIIHDSRVDRTTDHQGEVRDFSYQQMTDFDAGSWYSEHYRGEKVPTFQQFINYVRDNKMSAVIEIKPYPGQEQFTAEKTIRALESAEILDQTSIVVSSFSVASLHAARTIAPQQHLGLAIDKWDIDWRLHVKQLTCASLHVDEKILTKEHAQKIKQEDLYLFVYTVNESARADELLQWGVDGIFSDYPERLLPINT